METVADYLTRDRRSDRPTLVDAAGRTYDAHWLATSAWKAGNFLRHTGVRRGVTVGVVGDGPLALLSFLGTALLSGRTWFDPPSSIGEHDDVRTLVAPADRLDGYDPGPATQRVCYGGEPTAPEVHHLDAGLWSENPSFPPVDIDPETPLLVDATDDAPHGSITHAGALAAARSVADAFDLGPGTRVVVAADALDGRAPFGDPRAVVAGVLAPLVADGVTVLGAPGDSGCSTDDRYLAAAGSESVPGRRIPLSAVALS